ncbi:MULTISPECIES: Zn-dependent alcohol dehydrogenase [Nocardia]|uniref:Zn-dependent alcohol dehydrogenase n=1 Tax=Nocardia TaxID=1817 RepID=UPI001894CE7E|nr:MULTISPECIES: Zn-dependent alcohol dehydrogenase [Nocardia]MBF6347943.1 Zn-dependent alcohol dehydrogenase [Nocardia flavorosea]
MKAILFDGNRNRIVEDMELRAPAEGEVVVRIHASGLCQSDLSVVNGTIPFPVPVVLGHEGAGVVEELGPGVSTLRVGDHVVTSTLANCARCAACVSGRPTMCRRSFGAQDAPFRWRGQQVHNFAALSTFSERIVVRAVQTTVIPGDIPFTSACLVGCAVLTGAGAVFHRAGVAPGDRVAVIGAGGVGLNVLQAARIAGATTIIAVDTNEAKRAQSERFGATHFVDSGLDDAVQAVESLTGSGVDHVFDCVGAPATVRKGVEMLDWGGQLILLGVPPADTELSVPAGRLYLDRSVLGCRYGSSRPGADIPRYLDLYRSGRLLLDELVTRTYRFDDFHQLIDDARAARLDRGVLTFPS